MSKAWDYAELSKAAKEAGGPEALMDVLVQSGKDQVKPWAAAIGLLGIGAGYGIAKVVGYFKSKKKASRQSVELAKQELIDGINKYDAEHSGDKAEGLIHEKG